jgi:hypothetical protein
MADGREQAPGLRAARRHRVGLTTDPETFTRRKDMSRIMNQVPLLLLCVAVTAGASEPKSALGLSVGQPPPAPRASEIALVMSAATLGDDCGQAEPTPAVKSEKAAQGPGKADMIRPKMKRRCEQSSMQLSVQAENGGATVEMRVTKVELFDANGKPLGELFARSPSVWSQTGAYQPWDQKIVPGTQLQVTYPLSQPNWTSIGNRRNQTFVLKATLAVGGADRAVQRNVTAEAQAILPPNVKT